MAIDIEAMRAKLNASKTGKRESNNTKWRPSQGDQTIRILPTEDGDPFKEFFFHYNVLHFELVQICNKNFLLLLLSIMYASVFFL